MKVFFSPTNVDMHPLYPTGHLSTNSDFLEGWYWLHFPSFLPGKSLCKLCSSAFLLGPSSVHTKQLWLATRNRSKRYPDKDKGFLWSFYFHTFWIWGRCQYYATKQKICVDIVVCMLQRDLCESLVNNMATFCIRFMSENHTWPKAYYSLIEHVFAGNKINQV